MVQYWDIFTTYITNMKGYTTYRIVCYIQWPWVTFKCIHQLQVFFVQLSSSCKDVTWHYACLGHSVIAELLVNRMGDTMSLKATNLRWKWANSFILDIDQVVLHCVRSHAILQHTAIWLMLLSTITSPHSTSNQGVKFGCSTPTVWNSQPGNLYNRELVNFIHKMTQPSRIDSFRNKVHCFILTVQNAENIPTYCCIKLMLYKQGWHLINSAYRVAISWGIVVWF